jgi:hypothetical protein
VIAKSSKPGSELARVTSAVRDALEELELVELLPAPALDLDAAQLAIDCSEESAHCLGELANRMEARVVIVPSVRKQSDGLELRLLAHDRTSSAAPAIAMRKQAGAKLSPALLETIPSMLREILEAEAPAEPETESEPEESEPSPRVAPRPAPETSPSTLPVGPIVLGASGAAVIVAGIVVGSIAGSTEEDYAKQTIATPEQAKAADEQRVAGETQALAANVLLGVGAAAVVGAGVWYLLDGGHESSSSAQARRGGSATLRPMLSPHAAWLELSYAWGQRP